MLYRKLQALNLQPPDLAARLHQVLKAPALEGLELYLFRAIVPMKKLDIRLDKLTDVYGSPSIDDIEK